MVQHPSSQTWSVLRRAWSMCWAQATWSQTSYLQSAVTRYEHPRVLTRALKVWALNPNGLTALTADASQFVAAQGTSLEEYAWESRTPYSPCHTTGTWQLGLLQCQSHRACRQCLKTSSGGWGRVTLPGRHCHQNPRIGGGGAPLNLIWGL